MKAKGIVAQATVPNTSRTIWPRWSTLDPATRRSEARRMEVYAAMVTNLDDNVGRLVERLKRSGLYDNTIFVFFSDNGAEGSVAEDVSAANRAWIAQTFDNRLENVGHPKSFVGYGPNWAGVSSTPWRMFKAYTYEGGTRTPAFVSGPGWRRGISDGYVDVKDWAPTFLALAYKGQPAALRSATAAMQGSTPIPFLAGRSAIAHPTRQTQCLELFGRVAVRKGDWKLTFSNQPWGTGRWELFDIKRDPAERDDISGAQSVRLRAMVREWSGCQARNGILWSPTLAARYDYGNVSHYFDRQPAK